jgi:hypothetical protein
MVVFDMKNRGIWYYAEEDEAKRVREDQSYRSNHRFEHVWAESVTRYLTEENARCWQWGYQSFRWYTGTIMALVLQCRSALTQGHWLELAGLCVELGKVERERTLKFSSEPRVLKYERCNTDGLDRGNATKAKMKEAWQTEASRIWASSLEIQQSDNKTKAAKAILAKWPASSKPPGVVLLRKFLSKELGRRHVLPEMKD